MTATENVTLKTFTAGQAAKATNVAYAQINYWAKTGFLVPSVSKARGSSTCRVYDFRDLVALRVAGQLREAGVALQGLRKVVEYLQKRGYERPLADAYLVVGQNGDVMEQSGAKLVSALKSPGQAYLVFALHDAVDELMSVAATLKPPSRGKACKVA